MTISSKKLTPGVMDNYAKNAFKYGACGALAIAIHDVTGWPIVAITDHHNVYQGKAGGGSALHWTVQAPNEKLIDIDGAHDQDELLEEYHPEADDEQADCGLSSREDAIEWYVECQGEPIPISLAATFVEPLLQAIHDQIIEHTGYKIK